MSRSAAPLNRTTRASAPVFGRPCAVVAAGVAWLGIGEPEPEPEPLEPEPLEPAPEPAFCGLGESGCRLPDGGVVDVPEPELPLVVEVCEPPKGSSYC